MRKTSLPLPNSRSLRALEATVRLGTATKAAAELGVTQTAISHNLKTLEEQIGVVLFSRHARRLTPTKAARQLADAVRESTEILDCAMEKLAENRTDAEITISMLPALANKWLVPQLSEFVNQIDNTTLRISASRSLVDFQNQTIDAAIRYGKGDWDGVTSLYMAHEHVAPVMSPDMARSINPSAPCPLQDVRLLRCDNPDSWEDWFAASGMQRPSKSNEIFFDEDATMIEAAISGHGVALGRFALVAHDVRAGRLVAPFEKRLKSTFSYWFVHGKHTRQKKAVRDFFRLAQARITQDAQLLDVDPLGG